MDSRPSRATRWLTAAAVLAAGSAFAGVSAPPAAATTTSPPAPTAGQSYLLASADGTVRAYGQTASTGNPAINPARPMVAVAASPSGKGWWMTGRDGGVFAEGDAAFYGSTGAMRLNQPIVGMAATPTGKGYWFVASDGGIFSFGDAAFYGSTGAMRLNQPIVGMTSSPTGKGYWFVAADGGIFSFGDARFYGSAAASPSSSPVRGMASTATGLGYWVADAAGGLHAFGDARLAGSPSAPSSPIVGVARLPVPPGAASSAVAFALSHVGDPYVYGGTGPNQWDCSGLTMVAYQHAGLTIPRVAQDQYDFGPHLPATASLAPGDLLFFGSGPTAIEHVGMYVGNGQMVDAPHTGAYVEVTALSGWSGFQGATRPTGL